MKYQKIKGFNKKVAEVAPVDEQSEAWISAILKGLELAEGHHEYHEGFLRWMTELSNYLEMFELHFTKETHLHLIHLMYKHMTDLSHDSIVQQSCMSVFNKLLKKRAYLTPDDLQLAWRPLYELGRHYKNFSASVIRHGNEFIKFSWPLYHRCLSHASCYFGPGATREIVAELSPRLCVNSVDFEANANYLAMLPVCLPPAASPADSVDLWAGPAMRFWAERAVGTRSEIVIVRALAPLATHWRGHVDWEPHLANLCTLLHRCMRLPVGKSPNATVPPRLFSAGAIHAPTGRPAEVQLIQRLCGALVGAIVPGSSAALQHLRRLMQLLEPYMHPSNGGRWHASIGTLFCSLLSKLHSRLVAERHGPAHEATWWRLPPAETHIDGGQIGELFDILLEPMYVLVHGRGQMMLALASVANLLCQLSPVAFLGRLFAELQPAMLDYIQPHRVCALLLVATRVALAIVRHAPEEVAPLLYSILPLLELSNPLRLSAALALVQELTHDIGLDAQLEEFAAQFMDRTLAMLDSLLQGPGFGGSAKSLIGLSPLLETFYHMMMRGTEEVRSILVARLLAWSAGAAYEPEGTAQAVLRLFTAFSGSAPAAVVPWCLRQAAATVEAEGGPELAKEERVSSKLLWDVAVLESAASNADTAVDDSLLAGREQLATVLRCCLRARDRRLSQLAQRLFVGLATGNLLAEIYPTLPMSAYQRLGWGERCRLQEVPVLWHTPRLEEMQFIQWLADQFLWPEVQLLRRHLDGTEVPALEKQELLRCVSCLSAFAQSAWRVLAPPPEATTTSAADEADFDAPLTGHPASVSLRDSAAAPLGRFLAEGAATTMTTALRLDNRDARAVLLELFLRTLRALENTDLSEVLQQAIAGYTALLLPGPRTSINGTVDSISMHDRAQPQWDLDLGRRRDSYTRHLRRLTLFAQLRTQLARGRATGRLPEAVALLARLVGSPYRAVSCDAAAALLRLCSELGPLTSSFRLLAPELERLAGSDCEHQVLGALTLMLGGSRADYGHSLHLFFLPDWSARRLLCRCMATVQLSEHSNKVEIESLLRRCVSQMSKSYHSLSCHDAEQVEQLVSELTALQAASTGWKCTHLTADSLQFALHPGRSPSRRWLQFFLRLALDVNVRCRERAFACLAAFIWRRKVRAPRTWLPLPPQPCTAAAAGNDDKDKEGVDNLTLVHADFYRHSSDHVLPLAQEDKGGRVFRLRDPAAPPDYVAAASELADDSELALILEFASDRATWDGLLGLSLSRGGLSDAFLSSFAHFAACLTRVAGPTGAAAAFGAPLAELLAEPSDTERHLACHKMGSSLWFALVAGTKHWLAADRAALFNDCLLPALFQCQASADTWDTWRNSYVSRFLRGSLDPALLWPLADAIGRRVAELDQSGGGTAAQYCLLFTVQRLLLQYGKWRYPPRMLALLTNVLQPASLSGPYADSESVRTSRRACISHCLDCLGADAAEKFLAAFVDAPADGAAFKTLVWALSSHVSVPRTPLAALVAGAIAPLCRALQLAKTDEDRVKNCLQQLAGALILSRDADTLTESLSAALTNEAATSWQGRRAALRVLQGLAYHNAFQLDSGRVRALALERLRSDPVPEVRECAAQAFSGLLACGLCRWDAELSRRLGGMLSSADPLARHAGALGISACVAAHPYTVPEHLPELVAALCQLVHESGPVGAVAKRAVNDFKRTHQDGWERDRAAFTSDQLALLSDTVAAPSYYA